MVLDFFKVNIVSMPTSMSRRPDVIVAGRIVVTAISMANRTKGQLILILRAVSGDMSWLATLEAQSILRTKWCSIGRRR